jgi:hypothetical protein
LRVGDGEGIGEDDADLGDVKLFFSRFMMNKVKNIVNTGEGEDFFKNKLLKILI